MLKDIRVFVDAVTWHIRPNHTDWQALFDLPKISEYCPSLQWVYPHGRLHSACVNARYIATVLRARYGLARAIIPAGNPYAGELDASSLRRAECDVIYCHSEYPRNASVPVLWRNTILDPLMQRARGVSSADLKREIEMKLPLFASASLVQVATRSELRRMGESFPQLQGKLVYMPYFLPYIKPIAEEEVARKYASDKIHFVFVGRHGRRKGLDLFIEAMKIAGFGGRQDVDVSIVSALDDGPIDIPKWRNLKYFPGLPRNQVMHLLDQAHVFVMPSRFESYGIAYIEAMARGLIPVVPRWEVQTEIVESGNAGIPVALEPQSIASAIHGLAESGPLRLKLALNALRRANQEYSPPVVAKLYADNLRRAAQFESR